MRCVVIWQHPKIYLQASNHMQFKKRAGHPFFNKKVGCSQQTLCPSYHFCYLWKTEELSEPASFKMALIIAF